MRFEEHVLGCEGCEVYVDHMRETIRLTGSLRVEDVPAEAEEDLLGTFRGWKETSLGL